MACPSVSSLVRSVPPNFISDVDEITLVSMRMTVLGRSGQLSNDMSHLMMKQEINRVLRMKFVT